MCISSAIATLISSQITFYTMGCAEVLVCQRRGGSVGKDLTYPSPLSAFFTCRKIGEPGDKAPNVILYN